ncbi:MAG: hypothetical protein IKN55_04270, partial [Oscillospiraceae bacterium]|nr:hypothetical protein [Oscillospiraceae bacterium]
MKKRVRRSVISGILALLLIAGAVPGEISVYAEEPEELAAVSEIQMETAPEQIPGQSEEPDPVPEQEQAPFSVSVTEERSPAGDLSLGSAFTLRGILTADCPLSRVYGGVYSEDGNTAVLYYETQPENNVCDIHSSFDLQLRFGRLPAGAYVYRITAVDQEGREITAIESAFTVTDRSTIPSDISLVDASEPAEVLPLGTGFTARGRIFSTYSVMTIRGGVYQADGTPTKLYFEDEPRTPTYNLSGRLGDPALFGELPAGAYVYRIEAEDLRGTHEILVEKEFRIAEDDSAPSDMQLYGAAYPSGTQVLGRSFGISGTVVSTYRLTNVTAGIYRAEGCECDYHDTIIADAQPDANTFSLAALDSRIPFGRLPEGDYVYRVTATDEKGTSRELLASPFGIRSLSRTADSPEVVMRGIDVSKHNGSIDWDKAYADGVDFAVMRIGVTSNSNANFQKDIRFEENYAAARGAGVKVGVYLYTSAYNQAEIE